MTTLQFLGDMLLHLDRHLVELVARYDLWIYALLFAVIFCETGLVVTPFLPGDSLLFGVGALSAVDASGTLQLRLLLPLLVFAAFAGNSANYWIGRQVGRRAFSGRSRLFRLEHLQRTEQFFLRHGGLAIALSRFMPIVRTFTPFVAGIGHMPLARYQLFNFFGALAWVVLFLCGGFLFGNLPFVKQNFGIVTLLIIAMSLAPLLWVLWSERGREAKHGSGGTGGRDSMRRRGGKGGHSG
ncbi:MAG: DedA family protein [Gammaproteobacteria bacterium]|nr:DedA family protein [Gammaproteobacteria bacterium]